MRNNTQKKAEGNSCLTRLIKHFFLLSVSCSLFALAACTGKENDELLVERTAEELYNTALDEAISGDIEAASTLFDEVEKQYPYSRWAARSQIMTAWALYQNNNYESAIGTLDRFIELNPAHENVDYAYYLQAMSYYERIVDVERDATMTILARDSFETLIRRFPDSRYTRDAQLKLDLTNSHLAGKQMAVGRFYLNRGQYSPAIRRFSKVVRDYSGSNQIQEALYRLIEANLALGLDDEAERYATVLLFNYPDSIWTQRMETLIENPNINHDPSLFESLVDRLF